MAFPTTGVLEDGSGANQDPLEIRWNGSNPFINGDGGMLALISNQITDQTSPSSPTTDCSSNYDGQSGSQKFSAPLEIWATITTTSTVTNDQVALLLMTERNVATQDGYDLQIAKQAGADRWRLRRRDNVTPSTLGADMSQEVSSGDSIGVSMSASGVLTAYYKATGGGAWTVIGTRTDTTYTGPFFIGMKQFQATPRSWQVIPFGGGEEVAGGLADDPPMGFSGRGAGW